MMKLMQSAALGAALAFSSHGVAAMEGYSDCFNDVDPFLTTEAPQDLLPESLRVTDADLAWLMRELERRAAEPSSGGAIADAVSTPTGLPR